MKEKFKLQPLDKRFCGSKKKARLALKERAELKRWIRWAQLNGRRW